MPSSGNTGTGDGPVVAFRADTDGLPILEDTGMEYASQATGMLDDGTTVPVMPFQAAPSTSAQARPWRWLMP
jgi:hypothetical protein